MTCPQCGHPMAQPAPQATHEPQVVLTRSSTVGYRIAGAVLVTVGIVVGLATPLHGVGLIVLLCGVGAMAMDKLFRA